MVVVKPKHKDNVIALTLFLVKTVHYDMSKNVLLELLRRHSNLLS